MIEATQRKLREVQFFFGHLTQERSQVVRNEPEAFGYYLSAFLSAARSVSWALQFEGKDKYDAWFPTWLATRTAQEQRLLTFLKNQRNYEQKRGGAEVAVAWDYIPIFRVPVADPRHPAHGLHWSGPPGTPEPLVGIPVHSFESATGDHEVIEACRRYFELLPALVHGLSQSCSEEAVYHSNVVNAPEGRLLSPGEAKCTETQGNAHRKTLPVSCPTGLKNPHFCQHFPTYPRGRKPAESLRVAGFSGSPEIGPTARILL
jgi:hypothetical protein